jgi:hypothetical protein
MGRVTGIRVASLPIALRWDRVRRVERIARSARSLAVDRSVVIAAEDSAAHQVRN